MSGPGARSAPSALAPTAMVGRTSGRPCRGAYAGQRPPSSCMDRMLREASRVFKDRFESMTPVERLGLGVDRVDDDDPHPDHIRQSADAPQGVDQQGTAQALSLEAPIDRQLPDQGRRDARSSGESPGALRGEILIADLAGRNRVVAPYARMTRIHEHVGPGQVSLLKLAGLPFSTSPRGPDDRNRTRNGRDARPVFPPSVWARLSRSSPCAARPPS